MIRLLWILAFLLGLNVSLGREFFTVWVGGGALLNGAGLQVHVLDIGQGDALLVTTPEQHHILIDGGPDVSVLEDLGNVLPLLWNEIDLLVLTHPHQDHVGGLLAILQRFQVKAVLLTGSLYENQAYEAFLEEVRAQDLPVFFARSDQDFRLGEVQVDVLYPFVSELGREEVNVNNASVVFKLAWGAHEILFTGDAEKEVEAQLLAADVDVSADVLKAGHHGSRSSSTVDFLEAVNADTILISCGQGNDYGHPHPETLEKARNLGMEVYRTDRDGRISVFFNDDAYEIETEK